MYIYIYIYIYINTGTQNYIFDLFFFHAKMKEICP